MKTMKLWSLAIAGLFLSQIAVAQNKTETFKVSGNCGMCKTRIEKAAAKAGAQTASWDMDKKEITVTYSSSSTSTAKIQQTIAEAGHDNAGARATNEAYDKLHGCCKYDRTASEKKESCCSGETTCSMHKGDSHEGKHEAKADCCKDGKCSKPGHDGKDCCKTMDCCKDGKCTKPGHDGKDCCKAGKGKEQKH